MKKTSPFARVLSLGAASAFVFVSACSIFSGGDDSNGAASDDGGGSDAHDSGRRDSGSTRKDSGTSSTSDGGVTFPHDDAGHVIGADGGPLLCDPQSLGAFSGGAYTPPRAPYADVCTQTDFTNYANCLTGDDPTQCAQFASGGARVTCGSCLLTPDSATRWGATVGTDPPTSLINVPGCLAIVFGEGTSSSGCAGSVQHAANCENVACDPTYNCAGATQDDLTACVNSAAAGECSTYETNAQNACDKDAGGADSMCNVSDVPSFITFMNLFCGTAG